MNSKRLRLAMFFAACLLCNSVGAQASASVASTGAVPAPTGGSTNSPIPSESPRRAINPSKDSAICGGALWAVKNNVQAQLSGQSIQSVNVADPTPVYAITNSTHCVTQLTIIDLSNDTYPYTLNYDVSVSGFLMQVYAEYNRATDDPFHLYTYKEFIAGLNQSQAVAAASLQIKRQQIAPYLKLLLNQNAGLPARIEVYSRMCSSQLIEPDLILQSQTQELLDRLVKDYLAAIDDAYAGESYNGAGYVETPGQLQTDDNLQSIYCVFYGIFPSNAHKGLSVLEASPKGSLFPVAWALGEITNEGIKAADLLPTLVKWYKQTLSQPNSRDSFAESDGAKWIHATAANLILSLAGKDENQYLNMMMRDPDPQIAKSATDHLLAAPSSATFTTQASDAQSARKDAPSNLVSQIKKAVDAAKQYPRDAVLAGDEGTVQVAFDYMDGKVTNLQIQTSSGSKYLDQAALKAVNDAVYPSVPQDSVGKTLHIVIPVVFRLGG